MKWTREAIRTRPAPELAGRDSLIEDAGVALDRIRNRLTAKSMLMVGLRGVGKTVLLNRICHDARLQGVTILPPGDRRQPVLPLRRLRAMMLRMNCMAAAGRAAADRAPRKKTV